MKRVKHRSFAVLILAAIIVCGLGLYIFRYVKDGAKWASFEPNDTSYKDGVLAVGTVLDRNGVVLSTTDENGERLYAEDELTRRAVFHAVGDPYGNIGTGALNAFRSKLIGFDLINGSYSRKGKGGTVTLSIDSRLNEAAYEALDGRKGAVAVLNYETSEMLCMVSNSSFDPYDEPDMSDSEYWDGVYINRVLSSAFTPGSIFKLVTSVAAIDTIDDIFDRTFYCEQEMYFGEDSVHCMGYHGEIDFEDALAQSCNCAFAQLTLEIGPETLKEYAEKLGLSGYQIDIDGIQTAAGSFETAHEDIDIAWSGIGQYNDTVNPCAMLRFVAAIANGGNAPEMTLLAKKGLKQLKNTEYERIINEETADRLAEMMSYNVYSSYGESNFPGLDIYAKSGTAEVGSDVSPHAWFVGFIRNEGYPYAFVVMVENGGYGSSVAGSVANSVLQSAVFGDEDQ